MCHCDATQTHYITLSSFMAPLQHHTSSDKKDSSAKTGILDFI